MSDSGEEAAIVPAGSDHGPLHHVVRRVRRVMAGFTLLLIAATWPLWRPGTEFPDIPWFGWAVYVPPEFWDWLWLIALTLFLLFQMTPWVESGERASISQCVLFGFAILLLPTDQHRLQPWIWQMLLGGVVIAVAGRPALALEGLRGLTVSIYAWSAVSKLDWAFAEGHGQLLLNGLSQALGLTPALWSPELRHVLALLFPTGELAVALLLAMPATRRIGLWGSLAMHSLLILTLGPLGLGHEWGVLLWNAYFIVQNLLIFGRPAFPEAPGGEWDHVDPRQARTQLARVLVIIACLLPGLSIARLWDWWPSWAVYSSRPAIVRMYVTQADLPQLPASLRPHVGAPQPLTEWCPVNLDAWSFATCWCPMYPQERYRLAIIEAVALEADIAPRITIESSPDRWTGRRTEQDFAPQNSVELTNRLRSYVLNTCRRGVWPPHPLD